MGIYGIGKHGRMEGGATSRPTKPAYFFNTIQRLNSSHELILK